MPAGAMPTPAALKASGLQVSGAAADSLVRAMEGNTEHADQPFLVQLGPGLPALPRKMVAKIEAGEYVDFNELPPAKCKNRPLTHPSEGQVVVVQAADLVNARRLIAELATWIQCFSIYMVVVTRKRPERLAEMVAYQMIITKASQKYRWPSWLIYDQNFRMEAAGNSQAWSKVEPGLYAQCFTGQARAAENWCTTCHGLDHATVRCPYRAQKRSWTTAFGERQSNRPQATSAVGDVCTKFNRYNGDCKFGAKCRFTHMCSLCGGAHPATRCTKSEKPRTE